MLHNDQEKQHAPGPFPDAPPLKMGCVRALGVLLSKAQGEGTFYNSQPGDCQVLFCQKLRTKAQRDTSVFCGKAGKACKDPGGSPREPGVLVPSNARRPLSQVLC